MSKLLSCALLLALGGPVMAQAPERPKLKHQKGLKLPSLEKRKALHAAALARHKYRALPKVTAAAFDLRTLGVVPPIKDQGQCGSCWLFSGHGTATSAMVAAGIWKLNTDYFSHQYGLDCESNGGCSGDDNTTVLTWIKAGGNPTESAYGPYTATARRCKDVSGMTRYKIADWGYADPGNTQTVAATQKIKDAMVAYRVIIGCAVAAGGDAFWDSGRGTGTGTSDAIDHDVGLIGWDDAHDNGDGSKGAWIMRNSWGAGWGDGGYAWIKYGAYSIGTEAVWASAAPLPPPIPPPGPGPTPGPTPPPGPGPSPPSPVAITLTTDQVQSVLVQANALAITETTTLRELLDRIANVRPSKAPPCPSPSGQDGSRLDRLEAEVADIRRATDAILRALLPPEPAPKPLPKKAPSPVP